MLTTFSNDGTAFISRDKQSKNSILGLPDPADEDITWYYHSKRLQLLISRHGVLSQKT